ncbi:glycoside hydrolase [Polyplosphaeria fusca]|uniref:Glycoside hydrolase n=1 Tax=Polyplosphaeria fusca TaxID=682080 RepID=A0A9P4QLI8_9PLEO|nr:glycoside hydrolase [Polyplosphaeria fusca]
MRFGVALAAFAATLPYQVNSSGPVSTVAITVDAERQYQTIDGFGISEAFQRANAVKTGLSVEERGKALDLLFSDENGAGLTILRNGIGSSASYSRDWMKSIAPTSPPSSNSTLKYEWDGDDAGQVWMTKEAMKRGLKTVYANAWSAPAYMKTNNQDSNGGRICGVPGANCSTGDWRQPFANYLVQLVRFYKEKEGIDITHLGWLNEPDLNQTYASMLSDGFQAADFLKILHPTLTREGFGHVKIVCCEATGWQDGEDLLYELQTSPGAEEMLSVYSSHGYSVNPALPLRTSRKVWQTEWADLNGKWNPAWDNLGKEGEGITWANKIHSALTLSNISGFLYWIGAARTPNNDALVQVMNGTVTPSGRLWAFAGFSRFVKPGATRVDARSSVGWVKVSAFVNADGALVVVVINNGPDDLEAEIDVKRYTSKKDIVTPFITDNANQGTKGEELRTSGDDGNLKVVASVKRRSMTSFVL